jgi:hypothetical protein
MVITIQNINYNIIYVSQKTYLSNFINICQIDISVNMHVGTNTKINK